MKASVRRMAVGMERRAEREREREKAEREKEAGLEEDGRRRRTGPHGGAAQLP